MFHLPLLSSVANHISNMNGFVLQFISEGSSSSGGLMLKRFIFV